MSLIEEMRKKAAGGAATATAAQAQTKAAAAVQAQTDDQTVTFEITEAEIKQNPAYLIATDTSKSEETRVKELIALKAYNKDLTEEQNAKNLQAASQMLMYYENQVLASAKKSTAFTNDDAFSLYDKAVRDLQTGIGTFKEHLTPMVRALGVLQKARDNGISTGDLLKEVQDMKDARKGLDGDLAAAQENLAKAVADRGPIEEEATRTADRLSALEKQNTEAKVAKATAEGIRDAEKAKYFFQRDKNALEDAEWQIKNADRTISTSADSIKTLSSTAQATMARLERQTEAISAIEAEIAAVEAKATELDGQLNQDEDTAALSRLLEITGSDFKEKRDALTGTVNVLLDNSIASFEKTMSRFESGGKEVSTMRDKVVNIGGIVDLCAKADAKIRLQDSAFISEQEGIVKTIKAEKGDEAIYDPAFETAQSQYTAASKHAKESLTLAARNGELSEKLVRQEGTYTALADAFREKFMDAQRLRTNAAVEVSSKLLTTTKSLELAIASETTGTVDDMLSDLGNTTRDATKELFNTLSRSKSADNQRMAEALQQSIAAAEAIDAISRDLREETKKGIVTREAMRQVTKDLGELNEGLANVTTNAERDVQSEGLEKAGKEEALRVANGGNAAPKLAR